MEQQNSDFEFGVKKSQQERYTAQKHVGEILRIEEVLQNFDQYLDKVGTVAGWARTVREQNKKTLVFIELSDGSSFQNLQIVCEQTLSNFEEILKAGVAFAFRCKGLFVKSPGKGQNIELLCKDNELHEVKIFGGCDQKKYPLAKKNHKPETLREIAHLRPRTNYIGAAMRVRNSIMMATHLFYQNRGFINVSTPCITASDCEGAGKMFQVTTTLPEKSKNINEVVVDKKKNTVDYNKDFFKKPAFLTVSGQLSAENYACSMTSVYTLGPTFRAENSNTTRHLAEFWMLEPELAFADINDIMNLAEDYLKFIFKYCLQNNKADLQFFDERIKKGQIEYITGILNSDFKRVDYADAVTILQREISENGIKFEQNEGKVNFGDDLASEHERYLTEKIYKAPIFLYNFPKEIKSFYMKMNPDNRTVAAFDCLVPQVGEIIGGSQREDSLEVLENRMKELGLNPEDYWWYLDLRRYGSVPHSGFGAGFERLVMLITGIENIRDVIPFPRYPGNCEF